MNTVTGEAAEICPVCDSGSFSYLFVVGGLPAVRCSGCGLVSLHPQFDSTDATPFGNAVPAEGDPRLLRPDLAAESASSRCYIDALGTSGLVEGRLLLIAPPGHVFAPEAGRGGFQIGRQLTVSDLAKGQAVETGTFDACVVLYQLEKAATPLTVLKQIHEALRPGGLLLLVLPSLDARPAWRVENRFYFDRTTLQSILLKSGWAEVWCETDGRRSGTIVTATRVDLARRPLCSIVVPVYNERQTFPVLMDALLAHRLPGMDREIIVVESNSPDGTREIVQQYRAHPEVKIVLQERPRGKGNAVRAGFAHATGDIVLIQDADLEYDLNDYQILLEPLLSRQALFVLGTRHGGNWKMRQFADQPGVDTLLNLGHLFFTTLINVLYGQRMTDPFTMFKVFYRDCLYGLDFECNRFDFDHELVIKLVRKGYRPLEIPVNYRSRSFKEGKKVQVVRDPLSWLWVDVKCRLVPLSRPKRPPRAAAAHSANIRTA